MQIIDVFKKASPTFPEEGFPLEVKELLQNVRLAMHGHAGYWEIVLVLSGRATHQLLERSHELSGGEVLVLPPGSRHTYRDPVDFRYCNILAKWEQLGFDARDAMDRPGFRRLFGGGEVHHLKLDAVAFEEFRNAVARLRLTLQRRAPGFRFDALAQYSRLLLMLCDAVEGARERRTAEPVERLARLEEYLEAHYAEPLRIAEMCRLAMVSRSVLFALFQRYYGMAPQERLASIRLRHACQLLEATALPVAEVARRCGYNTPSFFIALFRRHHGMTPAVFRRDAARRGTRLPS